MSTFGAVESAVPLVGRPVGIGGGGGNGGFKVIDRSFASTPVTLTTAETTVYSMTVPANMLGANGQLRLWLGGTVVKNISNGQFTVRVKLGGTTIASAVVTAGNNIGASRGGGFSVLLSNTGTTNSQKTYIAGSFTQDGNNSGYEMTVNGYGASSVDTTTAQPLLITVQPNMNSSALAWTQDSGNPMWLELR